ncbi:HTH_Tnp_Tc3_2 domain-containing protein [Trichonephila clavipes]|nr:HTH_Tnp_Tc3_2 domain-containing protein [Trichonephila clavipes]
MECPTVALEEFAAVDDDNLRTASIMAAKDTFEFQKYVVTSYVPADIGMGVSDVIFPHDAVFRAVQSVSWSADCEGVPCDVVCDVGGKELFPECACDCPASKRRSSKLEDENEEERKSKGKKAKKLTKKMATSLFKMLGKTLVPIAIEKTPSIADKLPDLDAFDSGQIAGAPRMRHSISEIFRQLGFSRSTVSRVYQEYIDSGQKACRRPTREPLFNAHHRVARFAWVREHRDWSVEDWKRVTWSAESRFRLLNADGRLRI